MKMKMSNTEEDEAAVIQTHVKVLIVFLVVRTAAENQSTDTRGQYLPRDVDIIMLRNPFRSTSITQSGGSSSRSHSFLFHPK